MFYAFISECVLFFLVKQKTQKTKKTRKTLKCDFILF